jgi:hypothetical protein
MTAHTLAKLCRKSANVPVNFSNERFFAKIEFLSAISLRNLTGRYFAGKAGAT